MPQLLPSSGGGSSGMLVTQFSASDFSLVAPVGTTASIVSGNVNFTIPAATVRYGTVVGVWTDTSPRAVLDVPTGTRELIALARIVSTSGSVHNNFKAICVGVRAGADPAAPPDHFLPSGARMPGSNHWDLAAEPLFGELYADTWPGGAFGGGGSSWNTPPTKWYGIHWRDGFVSGAGSSEATPTLGGIAFSPTAGTKTKFGAPAQIVVSLQQYAGGADAEDCTVAIAVWTWG